MTEVEKGIQEIENVNLLDPNAISLIENIIKIRFKKLPSFRLEFDKNSVMIRCRALNDNEDFHKKISDCSYNPYAQYIEMGRANYEGQSIFYAARNRGIAMAEVRIMSNNIDKDYFRCTLSAWQVVKPLQLAVLIDPMSIPDTSDPQLKPIAGFIKEAHEGFKDHADVGEFLPLWQYMSQKYTEIIPKTEAYKYKITSAFSNFIYDKLDTCDGIFYQSVKDPNQFNIALKKEAVDSGTIKLLTAIRQRFDRTGEIEWSEQENTPAKLIDYSTGDITWP